MNLQIKFTLVVLSILITGISVKSQTNLFPVEGSVHVYACTGISVGTTYTFYVTDENGKMLEDEFSVEFSFVNSDEGIVDNNGTASTSILWKEGASMQSYKLWLEASFDGCSNNIFIGVSPQPNNRSIGFDAVASNECFSPGGNGFELPVSLLANNGEPLPENHYPVNVSFTVNGTAYQQELDHGATVLQISETMFSANHEQDIQVVIEITGATDAHSADIYPDEENRTHARTIFAIPVIEFTQRLKLQKELNEETTAHIMYSPVGFDWQEPGSDYAGGE